MWQTVSLVELVQKNQQQQQQKNKKDLTRFTENSLGTKFLDKVMEMVTSVDQL